MAACRKTWQITKLRFDTQYVLGYFLLQICKHKSIAAIAIDNTSFTLRLPFLYIWPITYVRQIRITLDVGYSMNIQKRQKSLKRI